MDDGLGHAPAPPEFAETFAQFLSLPGSVWERSDNADVHRPSGLMFPDDPHGPALVVDVDGAPVGYPWSRFPEIARSAWTATGRDTVDVRDVVGDRVLRFHSPACGKGVLPFVVRRKDGDREGEPDPRPTNAVPVGVAREMEAFLFRRVRSCDACANAGDEPVEGAGSCGCMSPFWWHEMRKTGAREYMRLLDERRRQFRTSLEDS